MAYRIKNNQTGEEMLVQETDLPKYGLQAPVRQPTEAQLSTAVFSKTPSPMATQATKPFTTNEAGIASYETPKTAEEFYTGSFRKPKEETIAMAPDNRLLASADYFPVSRTAQTAQVKTPLVQERVLSPTDPEYYLQKKAKDIGVPEEGQVSGVEPKFTEDPLSYLLYDKYLTEKQVPWEKGFGGVAGQFGENLGKEAESYIEGIKAIPELAKLVIEKPELIPELGLTALGGMGRDVVNLIRHPILSAYNKPISSTLDALAIYGAAAKGVKAFKAAKGVKEAESLGKGAEVLYSTINTGKVADIAPTVMVAQQAGLSADDLADIAKILNKGYMTQDTLDDIAMIAQRAGKAQNVIDKIVDTAKFHGTRVEDVNKLAEQLAKLGPMDQRLSAAMQLWINNFTVPTKRATQLNTPEVARKMLEYGIAGPIDDLAQKADMVTGKNGLLSRIAVSAAQNADEQVDVMSAINHANKVARLQALPASIKKDVLGNITDITKDVLGLGPKDVISTATKLPAPDAFRLAQQFEDIGHALINRSTYLTDVPMAEFQGQIYLSMADDLIKGTDRAIKTANVLDRFKTTQVLSALRKVSPKLADEFKAAKSFSELRALQSPFVRMSKMADLTILGRQSLASKGLNSLLTAAGAAAVTSPFGLPTAIVSGVAAPIFQKYVGNIIPTMSSRTGLILQNLGPKLGAFVRAAVRGARAAAKSGQAMTPEMAKNLAIVRAILGPEAVDQLMSGVEPTNAPYIQTYPDEEGVMTASADTERY